jgi:hypothetical protein
MKTIIISALVTVLLVGCSSVQPFRISGEKEATLRCIRRSSWEALEADARGDFPVSPEGLVQLNNETGLPVLYGFIPWWGDMDNMAVSTTTAILSGAKPATYIPAGKTAGIRIMEPLFFRDGALLTLWTKSAKQEDSEKWVSVFDFLRFQRVTGEEMRNHKLAITIRKEASNEIKPAK